MEKTNTDKKRNPVLGMLLILVIVLVIIVGLTIYKPGKEEVNTGEEVTAIDAIFTLDNGLAVTQIDSYTGAYMEDATDEEVTDVMMIMVRNIAENALQYAEITLSGKAGDALFKLSTLGPGQTAMVLESERKTYAKGDDYTEASAEYVVFFDEALNTYEDTLKIQPLDGGFNITNISEEDITGEIMVYFKDYAEDALQGGITYRGRIEGGLKAGEVRQIMTDNFTESNTKVMFITITETEE